MANIDLTKYGISGTKEIVYNPSYEQLFKDEMDPALEGYDKGQLTELDAVNVMARMKVYGVNGQLLQKQEKRLTIPANGHVDAFQLAPLSEANGYLFLEINGTTNVYALSADSDVFDWDNSTWYDTPLLHQADHKAIGASRIDGCRISETHKIVDGKTLVTLTATNPTDRVAYLLQLSLRTPKGKLIDGVTFSDNYISLEPNSSCEVSCEFDGQQKFKTQIEGRD